MVEIAKEVKCPRCGTTAGAGNFCTACGHKLVQECDCWVLRKKAAENLGRMVPMDNRVQVFECGPYKQYDCTIKRKYDTDRSPVALPDEFTVLITSSAMAARLLELQKRHPPIPEGIGLGKLPGHENWYAEILQK